MELTFLTLGRIYPSLRRAGRQPDGVALGENQPVGGRNP
jgi:hypothetical protein